MEKEGPVHFQELCYKDRSQMETPLQQTHPSCALGTRMGAGRVELSKTETCSSEEQSR